MSGYIRDIQANSQDFHQADPFHEQEKSMQRELLLQHPTNEIYKPTPLLFSPFAIVIGVQYFKEIDHLKSTGS
jgi:hypothetical protein